MNIVLAHGTFDMLHPGHIAHLEEARSLGDRLVVSVTADEYVLKGPGRPFFPLEQRMQMLRSLKCVDEVIPCYDHSAYPSILAVKPSIYIKGKDYEDHTKDVTGKIQVETSLVETMGGRVVYTDTMLGSSSHILNHINRQALGDAAGLKFEQVSELLDQCADLSVAVVGEYIRDEYIWVEAKGKSPKGSNIVYARLSNSNYSGGIDAVWEHTRQLCPKAELCRIPADQVVTKRRFIDNATSARVYSEVEFSHNDRGSFGTPKSDLIIAVDYGHGFVLPSPFLDYGQYLALTVQANSLSHGYNVLGKYPRAQYVVCDEVELRVSCNDPSLDLESLISRQAVRMGVHFFVCTIGSKGCIVYEHRSGTFAHVPALVDKVVDSTGAGDAFLAYTAPLAYLGADSSIIGLVGNAAGGLQCQVMGNEKPVNLAEFKSFIKRLLA